ncbi:MAG TPA: winged helix-turn-helix domain-containing protein [Gammaproteobacteria bacterium]|nr:winged helix-turn-helix domain-containing protein [Gammaproteobacteria bacterium]
MNDTTVASGTIGFGAYRFDARTGELWRDGVRLPLQGQPIDILAILLERPGELVRREEFRSRLWAANSYVDFDHGLNAAVKRLRAALNDSADTPQFIETLPRRGYRFIAQLDVSPNDPVSSPMAAKVARDPDEIVVAERPAWRRKAWLPVAALLLIVIAGVVWDPANLWPSSGGTGSDADRSVAVLPFENLSGNPANRYFADGVQEEILTRLAHVSDLKVISRTSVRHYRSAPKDLPTIAAQLGVAYVLEGSVQRVGDQVRINVQLINAHSDTHLWAGTYDRKLTDIFAAESEIARKIADSLQARLTLPERQRLSRPPTADPAAYDAYLRGRAYSLRPGFSPPTYRTVARYYSEAVKRDPQFALAWARLSQVDSTLYFVGFDPAPARRMDAKRAADTALKLQPDLGEAHLALGYYYGRTYQYADALTEYGEARRLLPNSAEVLLAIGRIKRKQGSWRDALAHLQQAVQLDPRNTLLLEEWAATYTAMRRFREALAILDRALEVAPYNADLIVDKVLIYQAMGDLQNARQLLAPLRIDPRHPIVFLTQVAQPLYMHRYAAMLPDLRDALEHIGSPGFPLAQGIYSYYLGLSEQFNGDTAAAHADYERARAAFAKNLAADPDNPHVLGYLGLVEAGLGNKAAALDYGRRAVSAYPADVDAIRGPAFEEDLAQIEAQVGDPEQALAMIRHLLHTSYLGAPHEAPLTPALLRLDPIWDPLRSDPRFKALSNGR